MCLHWLWERFGLCTYVLCVNQVMSNLMRGDLEINKSIGLVYVQLKIVGTIVVLWVQNLIGYWFCGNVLLLWVQMGGFYMFFVGTMLIVCT